VAETGTVARGDHPQPRSHAPVGGDRGHRRSDTDLARNDGAEVRRL